MDRLDGRGASTGAGCTSLADGSIGAAGDTAITVLVMTAGSVCPVEREPRPAMFTVAARMMMAEAAMITPWTHRVRRIFLDGGARRGRAARDASAGRQASVTVDDLRGERFVAMRPGYLMHRYAHRLFGSDLPPDWHSTDGAEMGELMVAEGIGLTVLPDYSVLGDPLERAGLIVARPLAGEPVGVTMVALFRHQAKVRPIVRDLLTLLQERAARPRPAATA